MILSDTMALDNPASPLVISLLTSTTSSIVGAPQLTLVSPKVCSHFPKAQINEVGTNGPTGRDKRGIIATKSIFVALALRFDVSRGRQGRYFNSAFFGYTFGLVLTIVVMNWFQAAQPALLYIVPAVIGSVAIHCLWNGEVKLLLDYNESKTSADSNRDSNELNREDKANKKDE